MSLEARLFSLRDALSDVAVGQRAWADALGMLAAVTRVKSGELIGFGEAPLQIITEVGEEDLDQFRAARGHDPAVSSRVRVGMRAPEMTVLDESDFTTEDDRRRHRAYGRVLDAVDIPFAHLAVLERTTESVLGLTLLSSARLGPMDADSLRVLEAAMPHIRCTVRFQRAAEDRAMALTAGGFERAGVAAFLLDRGLRLRACSAAADALLSRGDFRLDAARLRLRNGGDPAFQLALRRAASAASLGDAAPETVRAQAPDGLAYVVEAAPLPRSHDLPFAAGVLVVARAPRCEEARAARVAALIYGLTPAEAAVAALLAKGLPATTIAERQGIGTGTVRTHIRRLLEKSGARKQVDLVAAMSARL